MKKISTQQSNIQPTIKNKIKNLFQGLKSSFSSKEKNLLENKTFKSEGKRGLQKKKGVDPEKQNEEKKEKEHDITQEKLLGKKQKPNKREKSYSKKKAFFHKIISVFQKTCKIGLITFTILFILLSVFSYFYVLPLLRIKQHVDTIQHEVEILMTEIDQKNLSHLQSRAIIIESNLSSINKELERYMIIERIPIAKDYYPNLVTSRKIITKGIKLSSLATPEIIKVGEKLGYMTKSDDTKIETIDLRSNHNNNNHATDVDDNTADIKSVNNNTNNNDSSNNTPHIDSDAIHTTTDNATTEDLGVKELIQLLPMLSESYKNLKTPIDNLIEAIEEIDPEYIPTYKAKQAYKKVTKMTTAYNTIATQIEPTLNHLPNLLGANGKVTYLVVLQNEKEIRSSGGLLTAYTIVQIKNGEIVNKLDAIDMWELEFHVPANRIPYKNEYGQLYLMNIGCGASHLRAQDAGVSPDVYISMDIFKDYYDVAHERFPNKFPAYDHIISLNTFLASDLISLVEPVVLEDGTKITSENLARTIFSEANTFQRKLRGITSREDRKVIIGNIGDIASEKFMNLDSEQLTDLIDIVHRNIVAKNLVFYSTDKGMLKYFDSLDLTGRLRKFDGDYFHLSEAQVCSLKANFFVYDTVTQNITIAEDGTISRDVTVEWTNEKIIDIYEAGMLSTAPSYRYKAWIRFMVPPNTRFTSSDGLIKSYKEYKPVTYYSGDLDKEISDNVIIFDPRRFSESQTPPSHTLNVSYTLPKSLAFNKAEGYAMLLQKHPGKDDEKYIINLNYGGKEYNLEFRLTRDMIVRFDGKQLTVEDYPSVLDDYVRLVE